MNGRRDIWQCAGTLAAGLGVIAALCVSPASAEPSFYAGKQITFICGSGVGGGYDLLTRLTARHLGRLIPGHPTVIVQNMPAAGSLAAANHIYNTAPKDGTVIALIQRGMLLARLTNPSGVRFELEKLNWLGSLNSETGLSLAWHTAPHRTTQDLFDKELIIGGQTGADPETTPRLYNSLIGTRFKIITGYSGTATIALAMERGEVFGIGDWSWSSLKKQKPDWLRDKKVTLLMQGALQKDPELPQLPSALDFVQQRGRPQGDAALLHAEDDRAAGGGAARRPGAAARRAARRLRGARHRPGIPGRRGALQSRGRAARRRGGGQDRRADRRHAGRRGRALRPGAGAVVEKYV